ncbi:unnamed protein product [Calypogeia fissa]
MATRSSASLLRATVNTSDKMLARTFPSVFRFEVMRTRSFWSPITTLDGEPRSACSSSSASSSSRTPLETNLSNSLCKPVVFSINPNQRSDFLDTSPSRRSWDLGQNVAFARPRVSGWISLNPKRPTYEHCGYTTASINILEPGKYWRGKGWNRVGMEEEAEGELNETDPSTASQFDAIPDLEEKLKFLETCGLGDNQLEQMRKRRPSAVKNTFLKLSVKKLEEVAIFMEEEVGVKRKDFGNILFSNPFIAGSRVDDCLRPKIEFLRNRGISKEQMGKMVVRSPQILTYSLEGKLLAIEKKLLEIGLKGDEIGKIFIKHPAVFGTSISKFDKNIQSLRDGGIKEVAKAIFKLPQIMSLSLDSKFQQVVQFLRDDLKLQQEQITKMLTCQISILSFSIQDNMRPKVGYFYEMGLQQEDIARLVVKYPNVFCHSLDNSIKPKVRYLLEVMKLEVLELICFPHYLSYSLLTRIIPRHEYVAKHCLHFRLSSLLSCGDEVFQKRYPKPLYSELEDSAVQSI